MQKKEVAAVVALRHSVVVHMLLPRFNSRLHTVGPSRNRRVRCKNYGVGLSVEEPKVKSFPSRYTALLWVGTATYGLGGHGFPHLGFGTSALPVQLGGSS